MEADFRRQITCLFSYVVLYAPSTGHLVPCEAIMTRTLKCMVSDAPEAPLGDDLEEYPRCVEYEYRYPLRPKVISMLLLNELLTMQDRPGLRRHFLVRAKMPFLELLTSPDDVLVEDT